MDAIEAGKILTVKQVAQMLGLALGTVYNLCDKGFLAHHRFGIGRGAIRVFGADLVSFMQKCHKAAHEAKNPAATDLTPATAGATIRPFKHIKFRSPPAEPPASSGQLAG